MKLHLRLSRPAKTAILWTAAAALLLFVGVVGTDTGQEAFHGALGGIDNLVNPTRAARLADISQVAVRLETELGYPAEAVVAQWAVETGWGATPVCRNNYFGMKYDGRRHTLSCLVETQEVFTAEQLRSWNRDHPELPAWVQQPDGAGGGVAWIRDRFADYPDLESSARDYIWLVQHAECFRSAWEQFQRDRQLVGLLNNLAKPYATNPDYAKTVIALATGWTVRHALSSARERASPSSE